MDGPVNVAAETVPTPFPTFIAVLADKVFKVVLVPLITTFPWNVAFLSEPWIRKASCAVPELFLVKNLNPDSTLLSNLSE